MGNVDLAVSYECCNLESWAWCSTTTILAALRKQILLRPAWCSSWAPGHPGRHTETWLDNKERPTIIILQFLLGYMMRKCLTQTQITCGSILVRKSTIERLIIDITGFSFSVPPCSRIRILSQLSQLLPVYLGLLGTETISWLSLSRQHLGQYWPQTSS